MLRIKDINFTITEAVLSGELTDKTLVWGLSISTTFLSGPGSCRAWAPMLYSEELFSLSGKNIGSWRKLTGLELNWRACRYPATDEPQASIYVFEHADVYESTLAFGKTIPERKISVKWTGLCDIFAGPYYDKIHFELNTALSFVGIRNNSTDADRELRRYLPEDNFISTAENLLVPA